MATITSVQTVQRVFCTGDPTGANALGCSLNPGDMVVRTDGGTHYTMTAAGLVLEASMDQSPSFTTVAASTSVTVTSASAVALAAGLAGATNPAFVVDSSTASQAAGLKITGATAAGNVAAAVISSGTNANLTIDAKGSGTVTIGATSTGNVVLGDSMTITSAGAVSGITTLAIGGALSGVTTIANSGKQTNSTASEALLFNGAGTSAQYARMTSTGADLILGIASSTGTGLFTGNSNYAATLGTNNGTALEFGVNGTVAGRFPLAGGFEAVGGFGCNTKTAQTAYASGGALAAYGAGANGFDSGANASALHAMVVSIRAALVANGIMS